MRPKTEYGLTAAAVQERIKHGENNGSFEIKTKSVGQIVKDNVFTLFNLINVILALLVALTGSYRNMLFMGVIISNVAIGVIQEVRSKRVIDRLSLISAPKAVLMRDGEEVTCAVADIVLDDIMLLRSGMQICADAVVLSGECEVDESLVTGESDPVVKRTGDELLSGSFVVSGWVSAQVIRVGADSYANKITRGAKYVKKQTSAMMCAIDRIIRTVSVCIVPFALVLFFKAIFIVQQDFSRGIISTVAALIGMIPEGLVLLTSIALAVSSMRLARQQTLCQDLYCVEHLARVDVLCLDKTGTLTEGSMEFNSLVKLDEEFDSEGALCSFCAAMTDSNPTLDAVKRSFTGGTASTLTQVVPFSSARKWSAVSFADEGTYILGAPNYVIRGGNEELFTQVEQYASSGYRVLLLAHSTDALSDGDFPKNICPKALLLLTDKVRENAPSTLAYFEKQGVTIKVISGDDPATVSCTAHRAGLRDADSYVDVTALTDEELISAAEKYTVFGRVTPQRKLQLIRALKAAGHKVAMTGDGVNDVLALKEADCSVAMQSGSDAARSVSQLVLMNSDFAAMPLVVEEGRRAINNIQRSAALFLVKTIFSFLLAVVFLLVPQAYPFQPIQMTLISALAIGVPSFLLALEPNYSRVKGSFIANVMRRAFPGGASVVVGVLLLLAAQALFDIPQEQVSVIAVFLTATVCFGVLFNVCRPFNKFRAVMLSVLAGAFVGAVSLFPSVFYIVPLSAVSWGVFAVLAAVVLLSLILLTSASERLFVEREEPRIPQRVRKGIIATVFVISAVFAAWFGCLLADYFSLASGSEPLVASPVSEVDYDGVLYDVHDGEISVFGHEVRPIEIEK